MLFLSCLYECTGTANALPPVLVLALVAVVAWTKFLSFNVMGKMLSGELSCVRTGLVTFRLMGTLSGEVMLP